MKKLLRMNRLWRKKMNKNISENCSRPSNCYPLANSPTIWLKWKSCFKASTNLGASRSLDSPKITSFEDDQKELWTYSRTTSRILQPKEIHRGLSMSSQKRNVDGRKNWEKLKKWLKKRMMRYVMFSCLCWIFFFSLVLIILDLNNFTGIWRHFGCQWAAITTIGCNHQNC